MVATRILQRNKAIGQCGVRKIGHSIQSLCAESRKDIKYMATGNCDWLSKFIIRFAPGVRRCGPAVVDLQSNKAIGRVLVPQVSGFGITYYKEGASEAEVGTAINASIDYSTFREVGKSGRAIPLCNWLTLCTALTTPPGPAHRFTYLTRPRTTTQPSIFLLTISYSDLKLAPQASAKRTPASMKPKYLPPNISAQI
jgi:hypothetical protein